MLFFFFCEDAWILFPQKFKLQILEQNLGLMSINIEFVTMVTRLNFFSCHHPNKFSAKDALIKPKPSPKSLYLQRNKSHITLLKNKEK